MPAIEIFKIQLLQNKQSRYHISWIWFILFHYKIVINLFSNILFVDFTKSNSWISLFFFLPFLSFFKLCSDVSNLPSLFFQFYQIKQFITFGLLLQLYSKLDETRECKKQRSLKNQAWSLLQSKSMIAFIFILAELADNLTQISQSSSF